MHGVRGNRQGKGRLRYSSAPDRTITTRLATITTAALLLLLFTLPSGAATGLFGYPEKQYPSNAKMFPKWESMLQRAMRESPGGPDCTPGPAQKCHYATLKKVTGKLSEFTAYKQLEFVHRFVNDLEYISDRDNYGKSDYWATQHQMYGISGGDCEDYAITKYYALKLLGFDTADMRIVVVQDTNIDIAHAILVVRHDGDFLVLDNRLKSIVKTRRLFHLEPIFAINEDAWWRYTRRRKS